MEGRGNDGGLRDRRQFTVEMALALLGGAAVSIGCGGGASPSGPGPVAPAPTPVPTPSELKLGSVSNNHGHEAVITAAQLLAGDALRLEISGSAPHLHVVELSADEVARIRNGERVEKESSEEFGLLGLHRHTVRFN
jgi:hypothetical protein